MNPFDPRHPWSRLVAAARRARLERDASAPYGFATRVAAQAWADDARGASLLERFAFRAVGLAALLAVGSVALNYSAISGHGGTVAPAAVPEDMVLPVDDAIAAVLDVTN